MSQYRQRFVRQRFASNSKLTLPITLTRPGFFVGAAATRETIPQKPLIGLFLVNRIEFQGLNGR
jgi:hypothetical protein